jgi:uncharacterized membrane protein YfcA
MESYYVLQWLILLFFMSFTIGIIAPIGGVGGGVLFVPLATVFFPFHVDFIRGAGLMMALTSSLSSSPLLLKKGMANLDVAIPIATVSIAASITGSMVGLWYTNRFERGEAYFVLLLGLLLLVIFGLMVTSRRRDFPEVERAAALSKKPGMEGRWYEPSLAKIVEYSPTNVVWGMLCFSVVGFVSGMFGLGAGWASVPVLNLVMGIPLKASVATSMGIIVFNAAAASWVYLARGALLPLICIPSVIGMTVGSRLGARISVRARPRFVRYIVLAVMLFASVMNMVKGFQGVGVF